MAFAQTELKPLMPPYWVVGTVADTPESTVNNRRIFLFRDMTELGEGKYAESSCFGAANSFLINAFAIFPGSLVVGDTYRVSTEQDAKGYGADGYVKISGTGWDEVKGMALSLGGGIIPPVAGAQEPAPRVKIWFGNRLYQPALVAKGQPFVVSSKPDVRVEINIDAPYMLAKNIDAYAVTVDPGTSNVKSLKVDASSVASKTYAAGTSSAEDKFNALSLKLSVPEALAEGPHNFVVSARSGGTLAAAAIATETATVEVMGGPLRLVGPPLTYPSPFSISKQKLVTIQYGLSADANIDIYVIGVGGVRAKKFTLMAGGEGGSAGVNKVTWDGRTDMGTLAGNAIYVGSLISRDDGRLLGKFRLTIVD